MFSICDGGVHDCNCIHGYFFLLQPKGIIKLKYFFIHDRLMCLDKEISVKFGGMFSVSRSIAVIVSMLVYIEAACCKNFCSPL
jgi:hypothetical protein